MGEQGIKRERETRTLDQCKVEPEFQAAVGIQWQIRKTVPICLNCELSTNPVACEIINPFASLSSFTTHPDVKESKPMS